MNHYKDANGTVYGFESDDEMQIFHPGLTPMTELEFSEFLNAPEITEVTEVLGWKLEIAMRCTLVTENVNVWDRVCEILNDLDLFQKTAYEVAFSKGTMNKNRSLFVDLVNSIPLSPEQVDSLFNLAAGTDL